MIILKSETEIERLKRGNYLVAKVLHELQKVIEPGIATLELDLMAERMIRQEGGIPAFKGYRNYPASLCVSINEQVVHGIPDKRKINKGDIVSLDLGANLDGFYGDCGYAMGSSRQQKRTNESLISIGKWHHIAVVFMGHLSIDLYVDGIKRDGYWGDGTGGSLCYSSNQSGAIGENNDRNRFNGTIDDIRVYNRSLSEDEIISMSYCGDEQNWMPINGKGSLIGIS